MSASVRRSSHAKPVNSFARAAELENELTRHVKGEVRFDGGSRAMYAADASNYRQIPIGLVVPRDADDVAATVATCRKYGAPLLPRGGGTSLAGQCCNAAVVLDFTKHIPHDGTASGPLGRGHTVRDDRGRFRLAPAVVKAMDAMTSHRLDDSRSTSTASCGEVLR